MRLVVVRCPDWPVVAAGAHPGEPVAVLHANRVVARTPAAAIMGVRQGHRRREAQRICPELRIIDHDPARDGREFETAVRSVSAMVPRLETTEPGTLTFAARGPARYFGGEHLMAMRVGDIVKAAIPMVHLGIGIGDGRFTACVAARQACGGDVGDPIVIIDRGPDATRAYLAPQRVTLLRDSGVATAELVDLFHRLGLRTLGDLAALPAPDVLARFGQEGAFAHRLATGNDDRPPGTEAPPPDLMVARLFDDPVHLLDPLVFTAKQMAQELHEMLIANGRVCTRLAVHAETEHGERCEHLWYRPSGLNVAAIIERVRWQLDGWIQQPGGLSAGVVLLKLIPDEVRADEGSQLGFWGGRTEADDWAARAIARIAGLVGEQQVFVPAWKGGRLPSDTYQWVSIDRADITDATDRLAVADVPWPGQLPSPSPATVYSSPMPADVIDATGAVVRVNGRGLMSAAPHIVVVDGRAPATISAWAGPWPVDERWWDPDQHRRLARFQLTTECGAALLAVVENQRWWISAIYG